MFKTVESYFETDASLDYRPEEFTKGMTSHSTRKTVTSMCEEAGIPPEWTEVRAGTSQSTAHWLSSYYKGTIRTDEQIGRVISGTK